MTAAEVTDATPTPLQSARALVLRTCNADMTSYYGAFTWPTSGTVTAPDWNPVPECGGGLHGLLWGEGAGALLSWDADAKWLVVAVNPDAVVDLDGKVKFPAGEVLHVGDQASATTYLAANGGVGRAIAGGAATAGDYGTATAGYSGTATAGRYGTATAGRYGAATAGGYGTATAGDSGTATAGDSGILVIRHYDGRRYRLAVGYIGEDGLLPDTAYRLDSSGAFVAADATEVAS